MGLFGKRSSKQPPKCSALIAAAGSSTRMGENKLLMPLCGIPVIAHTLLAMERAETIGEIIVATREEDLLTYAEICKTYGIRKPVKVIVGGETRTESVYKAALEADEKSAFLAVQDGARPLVTPELIDRTVRKAFETFAAAPAIPVKDTIKVAQGGKVENTPDRATLFAIQTPQVFDAGLLKAALQSALKENVPITDDCSAIERLGKVVYLTDGSEENIKITTPFDILVAETILQHRGE